MEARLEDPNLDPIKYVRSLGLFESNASTSQINTGISKTYKILEKLNSKIANKVENQSDHFLSLNKNMSHLTHHVHKLNTNLDQPN